MDDKTRHYLQLQVRQHASRDGQALRNLESETVSLLMNQFRVGRYLSVLREQQRQKFGTPGLTVEIFNETADAFPYLLVCSTLGGVKLHNDKKSTLPKMFQAFDLTPLGKAFRTAHELVRKRYPGDLRQACLVVKRVGVRGGLAVYPSDSGLAEVPGLRLQYTPSDETTYPGVIIEPFVSFLGRVAKVWAPQFTPYEEND